ncbi:His Kinase A (phospho-acceptor) domain-containing protein [Marinobacter daqiaonensis]|uniref:histidine kinase n=1 Tax=Marinobacter daqiaonensis TaxID=650891 RepID=A0A1I6IKQ3_9GAMM|nr:ATP-binding protein [Marinobacter daqiaonensis]SFR67254.1 His Kinase A (phospho-acceptor) domain-containing protein [Marinobacter daqiaonensis]
MRQFEDDPTLTDLLQPQQVSRLESSLEALGLGRVSLTTTRHENAIPVEFNLETVAWLSGDCSQKNLRAAAELVSFILLFVAKYRLAANLHHDATEAGYEELQRKHEALKASEARYRTLSDQLQEKVKEQVETIQKAQQELYESAKTRSVGQLAAGIAHEINNPIGFMKSNLKVAGDYLDELEEKLPGDEATRDLLNDFRDLLAESQDGARRIATIVADLKTFSSIDHAEYTHCRINDLLKAAIHLLRTSYSDRDLAIDERLGELPDIQGNPARLSEAFYNVLDNAVRAIDEEGRIIVKTATDSSGNIAVVIQDNGCGIPEASRGQVFDPFYTSRPVGSGTGLGLTVARDTVRAHNGLIKLESRLNAGTRITLLLPSKH